MAKFDHIEVIDGKEIPFNIYIERRKSVRVSFGRSAINLRLPSHLSHSAREKHFGDAVRWVTHHADKNPEALDRYVAEDYDRKKVLSIYGEELNINIAYEDRQSGRGKYDARSSTIMLVLPKGIAQIEKSKMVKSLLSRVCATLFLPKIEARVRDINDRVFHKDIKAVRLKYNRSNWGSCSSSNNINLSTRLLFAPFDVIDYVIVHELAHLYEMNHGPKFWNIVQQVMPDYKEKEEWLKQHGHLCDF